MIRWKPEHDEALRLMHRNGCTYRQMSDAMMVSVSAARCRLKHLGLLDPMRGRGRPGIVWTVSMDKTLVSMREQRRGQHAIAKQLGVSSGAVYNRIRVLGLPTWSHGEGYRKRKETA